MGRHSAPEDTDEDVDTDVRTVDAPSAATAVESAIEAGSDARYGNRPRPTAGAARPAGDPEGPDGPPTEGLSLIDDALGPAPGDVDTEAPGDVDVDAPTTTIDLAALARHDRPVPEETTARIAPVVEVTAAPAEALAPAPPSPATDGSVPPSDVTASGLAADTAPARGGHATSADLALIRRHGDVRARVIAAVLAPFVVFVAVFAVPGNLDVHSLVWVWIPAVVAGVLVGVLLDAGHKRYPAEGVKDGHPAGS